MPMRIIKVGEEQVELPHLGEGWQWLEEPDRWEWRPKVTLSWRCRHFQGTEIWVSRDDYGDGDLPGVRLQVTIFGSDWNWSKGNRGMAIRTTSELNRACEQALTVWRVLDLEGTR